MENRQSIETGNINYSADSHKEIESIRAKYIRQEATGQQLALERMQKLDRAAESRAQIAGLVVGIVAALILGLGMSCALVWSQLVVGILVGVIGLADAFAAYPLYRRVLAREREKVAPEILRLSEEGQEG